MKKGNNKKEEEEVNNKNDVLNELKRNKIKNMYRYDIRLCFLFAWQRHRISACVCEAFSDDLGGKQ